MATQRLQIAMAIKQITLSCVLVFLPVACLQAAPESTPPKWIYPAVPGFGGVHPRADLPVRPDPKVDYKIFVDVASEDKDDQGRYDALDRLARLVNLMAYAGVPPEHVHIVALLDGRTGYASMTDDAYKGNFKT